jgi:hypothetical protein
MNGILLLPVSLTKLSQKCMLLLSQNLMSRVILISQIEVALCVLTSTVAITREFFVIFKTDNRRHPNENTLSN